MINGNRKTSDLDAATEVFCLLGGFKISQALYVVARLGVADHLLNGPRRVADLSDEVGARPDMLRRLLRVLTAEGIFLLEQDTDRVALGPLGGPLASSTHNSLRNLAMMWMETHYASFADLWKTVHDGRPAMEHHHGVPFFDWLGQRPDQVTQFSRAMNDTLRVFRMDTLRRIDLSGVDTVVDVGGADGAVLAELATLHPHLRGVVFDLPEVVVDATRRLSLAGVSDRITTAAGDFFEAVPAGADLYLACMILHDWNDEQATRILRAIHTAAPPGARLQLMDIVLPEKEISRPVCLMDLTMMGTVGGRERTEHDWRTLLTAAGFTLNRILRSPTPFTLLEATRTSSSEMPHPAPHTSQPTTSPTHRTRATE
ncbi:methyltransferase [Actinomadura kijaniata]|uniref:methyltransferase n=1 Tax=Actinomadura kijaniata TaxID=46161 RepID=UPI000829D768|nr:methyltransferase [Actinomadura kijaniata]